MSRECIYCEFLNYLVVIFLILFVINISTCSPAWWLVREREGGEWVAVFLLTAAVLHLNAAISLIIFCAR